LQKLRIFPKWALRMRHKAHLFDFGFKEPNPFPTLSAF
jgi:hypothetical protein